MKGNVLPKRMTAHLCRGSNSAVVSLLMWCVVCGVWWWWVCWVLGVGVGVVATTSVKSHKLVNDSK